MDAQKAKQRHPLRTQAIILILSSVLFIISTFLLLLLASAAGARAPEDVATIVAITAVTSALILVITSISTASTILLEWRNDHRQDQETRLKIKQLELQLKEMRSKVEIINPD